MNKILKYQSKDQNIFFSSDWHLGHKRDFVWGSRGFSSLEEHRDFIINKINERVKPNDILVYLGDFCLNSSEEDVENYLSQINCQNILSIWGNHNNPLKRMYDREVRKHIPYDAEIYPLRYKNLVFLGDYQEMVVDNQMIILCHYPLRVWNFVKDGAWMLSGHSHYNDEERRADFQTNKALDVGFDGKLDLYSFDELRYIMMGKQIVVLDHHKSE